MSDDAPLADEAARLVAAVEEWLRGGGFSGGLSQGLSWAQAHVGGAQECKLCPVCQMLALVRSTSPEVYEHLAEAAASVAKAGQVFADNLARHRAERPSVQRIDIGP